MSSQRRKVAEFAMGSSLEMFVLILITFLAAAVGDHLSCDEYCTSLKSTKIGGPGRYECNCYPQNAKSDISEELNGSPIYYEPVEFHPLPDISFVYQPFVISNPTSSSDNKPVTRSLSSQETEHHRKYKRKDNVIHKISIDTSKKPLYLDIDIKNSHDRSRSSQNYINVFDDLQLTEQELKDCIDLHLLFHFRRNESDNFKQNLIVENLEKYFHISDDDLMMELSKRCKQPSDIVDQSLNQIKERIRVIKPQYSNYSEPHNISDAKHNLNISLENIPEDSTRVDESLTSISTEKPRTTPEKYIFHNKNKEERNRSNVSTLYKKAINNARQPHLVKNEIKLNEESSSVIPIQWESDKLGTTERIGENNFRSNELNTASKTSEHITEAQSIEDDISYRELFNKPKLEQDSLVSLLTTLSPELSSTGELLKFSPLDNTDEKDKYMDYATTIIVPQLLEENDHSGNFTNIRNDMFSTTIQNYVTVTAFVTRGSNSNNDSNIEKTSVRDDIINTSMLKIENENDLEQSSSNMKDTIIKYTNNFPEITTKNTLNKSKEKPRSNELFVVSTDRNIYKYDSSPLLTKTHFKNNLTAEREMTTIESIKGTTISNTAYSEDNVTLFTPTTEKTVPNNITTYTNRTIIPENKLQIPRIIVTEYSNETVHSTIDGIEKMPSDDYIGITNFEMDVADLTSSNAKSVKNNPNNIGYGEHNETLDHIKLNFDEHNVGKEAEDSSKTSEISGNLYFMFMKRLIPMRFIQAPDGDLKLIFDEASFCKNLLTGVNDNNILTILCNSAVHDKNK